MAIQLKYPTPINLVAGFVLVQFKAIYSDIYNKIARIGANEKRAFTSRIFDKHFI